MANAYCLWRHSKSPMQSNLSPDSLVPPFHSPQSRSPPSYICSAEQYVPHQPRFPPPRGQCKLILSCIKRCEASHSSYPAATSLSHDISTSPFLHLSHFSFASNDIYAILIEYLLYMRLHIQAFSLPLPSTISHTFASLQCLCRWPKICEPSRIAQKPIPVVVYAVTNLSE